MRVRNDGHVEAGSVKADCFLINAWDSVNWVNRYGVYSDLGPYTYYNGSTVPCATSIFGRTNASDNSPYEYTNMAIGVRGEARGAAIVNYGVYGSVSGDGIYGAGVYGTIYSTPQIFADNYAGFFHGPVAITSGLYVKGGTYTSFWHGDYYNSENGLQLSSISSEEESASMTEQLSTLKLGIFAEAEEDREETDESPVMSMKSNGAVGVNAIGRNSVGSESPRLHYGLSADQLEEVFPSLVKDDGNGTKYINYVEMVPLLVQAINELSTKVATLEAQLGIQDPTKPVLMSPSKSNGTDETDGVALFVPDDAQIAVLAVYDMGGRLVRNVTVGNGKTLSTEAYTRGLPCGSYVCTLVVDGRAQISRKVTVKE
ncbi:MAG: hypothetical protein IJ064_02435 [Bacteroidaceae bacterium]|nr:hypothetical protein [Bacteroidaceae bacterium]